MNEFPDENAESSEEEEPVKDFDTDNVREYFKMCEKTDEMHVGHPREYVLALDFQNSKNILVSATSTGKVYLHQFNQKAFQKIPDPRGLNSDEDVDGVAEVKFDIGNENILFCTRTSGLCQCFDLRTQAMVYEFKDESTGRRKPFTCMDINQNSRIVCCGTEKIQADSFLLFFDTRQRNLLGGYWESHEDDITDVRFHPRNADTLASCSTDGLLNCYDLKQATEDDALIESFNTESSASLINWSRRGNADHVSCITHTNDLQLYNVESQDKVFEFKRDEITKDMKRNSHIDCYLVGCHTEVTEEDMFVLATSNFNRGECLRSLAVVNDKIQPGVDFLKNQQIVRCSHYDAEHKYLFTAGESGFIHFWRPTDSDLPNAVHLKEKHRNHKHHIKPY